jgi:hypothetical protein
MIYADLKALIERKNLAWQFDESSKKYVVWARDGMERYESELWKDGEGVVGLDVQQNAADLADFEANHKAAANYAIGLRQYAFATGDFDFAGDVAEGTCQPGETIDLDYTFTEQLYITGGSLILSGSVAGDWIEVHVVHPVYGAVKTYLKKRFVPAAPDGQASPIMELKTPYAGLIPAGLKIRTIYHSTGQTAVKIGLNLDLHRAI